MWNIKILMGPLGMKKHYFPKQGLRQPFQNAVCHKALFQNTTDFSLRAETLLGSADHLLKAAYGVAAQSNMEKHGICTPR